MVDRVREFDVTKVIFGVAIVAVVVLVFFPIGFLLWESLTNDAGQFTLMNFYNSLSRRHVVRAITNTLLLSFGICLISTVLGVTMAYGVSRTNMWGKALLKSAVVISIMTPPFLIGIAYIILGGPNQGVFNLILRQVFNLSTTYGPINIYSLWALILLGVPTGTSVMFLMTFPALENMDPSLEEAVRITGGSLSRSAFDVTLPLIKPAIFSGVMLVFGQVIALYGLPRMLNINVLTHAIREAMVMMDWDSAAVISVITSIFSFGAVLLYRKAIKSGKKYSTISAKGFRPSVNKLKGARHLFTALGVMYAFLGFLLPYGTLIAVSFMRNAGHGFSAGNFTVNNYINIFQSSSTRTALWNSTILAFGTATIVIIVGFVISYILVRTTVRGRGGLEYLSNLPMGLSGVALAMGLIFMYLSWPLNTFRLYGTLGILLIAYCTRQLPSGVRYSQTALLQINSELEEVSRVSGASWLRTMVRITIPLVRTSLVYAWILAFINAFPELSASVMLQTGRSIVVAPTILGIWDGAGGLPSAAAFGSVVFLLVAALVALATKATGHSMLKKSTSKT